MTLQKLILKEHTKMSNFEEINIKEGMPPSDEAMDDLKKWIQMLKQRNCKCVLIVHGYGSTGKGGVICTKSRQWLKAQERNRKIKSVIFGEDFSIYNKKALDLKNRFFELEPHLWTCNHGVTIVEL